MEQVQVKKQAKEMDVINWTVGSLTSQTVEVDSDFPIVGLAIDLSEGGELTFKMSTNDGTLFDVLKADGTQLSVDASTLTQTYRFYSEFAPARRIQVACTASQSAATITPLCSS